MDCDLYHILGVARDASPDEIKKSYRKLCIQHHPDKGGDEQRFKQISEAYNILKDPQKKQVYDQFGIDGLKQGMDQSSVFNHEEMQSMMENMFGFSPFGPNRMNQSRNVQMIIMISLEDVVNGNPNMMYLHRRKIIDPTKQLIPCNVCKGEGKRTMASNIGFMQMMQQVACPQCKGQCFQNINDVQAMIEEKINIPIPKNCPENHKFILKNKMDEMPNQKNNGDVILITKYKEHDRYKRFQYHLYLEIEMTLVESLFGFSRKIKLLNNEEIELSYPYPLKNFELLYIPEKGLLNPFTKKYDHLYLYPKIIYPTTINKDELDVKEKITVIKPWNLKSEKINPLVNRSPDPSHHETHEQQCAQS